MRVALMLYAVIAGIILVGHLAEAGRPEPTGWQVWHWCEYTIANESWYRSIPKCQ